MLLLARVSHSADRGDHEAVLAGTARTRTTAVDVLLDPVMDLVVALIRHVLLVSAAEVLEVQGRRYLLVDRAGARHARCMPIRLELESTAGAILRSVSCRCVFFATVATHDIDLGQVELITVTLAYRIGVLLQNRRARLADELAGGDTLHYVLAHKRAGRAISNSV